MIPSEPGCAIQASVDLDGALGKIMGVVPVAREAGERALYKNPLPLGMALILLLVPFEGYVNEYLGGRLRAHGSIIRIWCALGGAAFAGRPVTLLAVGGSNTDGRDVEWGQINT